MYRAAINKVGISFFFLEGNKKCDSQTNEIETARARENIIDTKFMTVHLIQRYSKRTSTNVNNTRMNMNMIEIDPKISFSIKYKIWSSR